MRALLPIALVGAMIAGCSSDSSVSYSNLEREFAAAYCDYVVNCPDPGAGDSLVRVIVDNTSRTRCIESVLANGDFDFTQFDASIAAGRLDFDGAAARRCLDAIVDECRGFDGLDFAPCTTAFIGRVGAGGHCSMDAECVDDAYCDDSGSPDVCLGVCTDAALLGEPCGGTAPDCDPHVADGALVCDSTPDNPTERCIHVTLEQVPAGEPCGEVLTSGNERTFATCDPGLYCRITLGDAGTCALPIAELADCIPNVDVCAGDALCSANGASFRCTPIVVENTAGAPCSALGPNLCNPLERLECNGVCEVVGDGTVGSGCRTEFPGDCDEGLYCNPSTDTCATQLDNDLTCDPNVDRQCASGYCDDQTNPLAPVCADVPVCP